MKKEHVLIDNDIMGRKYHLWKYGDFGMPLLVFPSAAGMAHEWDAHGMIEALEPLINGGKIKAYCTESNVAEAFTRKENDAAWRISRHVLYDRFIMEALVPWIREDCRTPDIPLACTGTSLGGYYAANFALKYPETFRYALCMSGRYDITHFTEGFTNDEVFFNNPLAFVPGLQGEPLEKLRRYTHLALVCGQGKWEEGCIEETQALGKLLEEKGVPSQTDIWGTDVSHDWVWWRRQAVFHLGHKFGG